jgi:ComF family protein
MASPPLYPSRRLVERALDLFFPPVCVGCRRVGRWICEFCWDCAPWIAERTCFGCGRPSPTVSCVRCSGKARSLERLIAVSEYDGVGREAVHALKFHGHHAISGLMGRLMAAAARNLAVDFVAPVPLHKSRRRERGYDQAALLARSVARALAIPCDPAALLRTRATQQQALLDGIERRTNMQGAFRSKRRWNGARILLVDDVASTCSTLDAAASALKEEGAETVVGLVFAH